MRQQRSVTISDVARVAGVSKATASVALSGGNGAASGVRVSPETRLRIQQAATQLGYERNGLALALSQGRTYTVGLVSQVDAFTSSATAINSYQKDVMVAVTCACARAGLRMTTILVDPSGKTAAGEIADGRVDGAVLATLRDDVLAREIFQRGFPAVTIGSGYSERRVAPDNRGGMRAAVDHLVDLGHRRIAYAQFPPNFVKSWTTEERAGAYQEAMEARGLTPRLFSDPEIGAVLEEPIEERPTACVCFNDSIALTVLRHARRRGIRVPEDLSVVGFDDGVVATCADPRLTTVANPLDLQADLAIALLHALWRGEPAVSPPPTPTHLIVRDSTAAAPQTTKELPG